VSTGRSGQFGDGVLFRITNHGYRWLIPADVLVVVASLPLVLAFLFLGRDPSKAILCARAAPLAPRTAHAGRLARV
jgi:hypothetical protein